MIIRANCVHGILSPRGKSAKSGSGSRKSYCRPVTGWVRIQLPDVVKTRLISILMGPKMQLLEVVTGHSEFLSHFSIPQAIPTQPVKFCHLYHNFKNNLIFS